MPNFSYVVRDKQGRKIKEIQEAVTKEELVGRLQNQGLIVIDIQPIQKTSAPSKRPSGKKQFTHSRARAGDLALFARQLSTLLGAGVTLMKGLDVILKQIESRQLYAVIEQMKKDVESGTTLRAALSKHPRIFSDLWINLIDTGEASGNLALILDRLAYYLETTLAFRRKIVSSLIYPILLFVVAMAAVAFFMIKIVPTFSSIFQGLGVKLPLLTIVLINVSAFMQKRLFIFLIILVAVIFVLKQGLRNPLFKRSVDILRFKLPLFGKFFQVMATERFASEISILVESGVPLLYALEIAERSTGNKVMEEIIGRLKESVRDGKNLSKPLEDSGFFSPMMVQMVMIGEEIGELPSMFKKVASFYQEYVETFTARFISLFEPMMIVFMGGIVGVLVISMFLPIFSIATSIK